MSTPSARIGLDCPALLCAQFRLVGSGFRGFPKPNDLLRKSPGSGPQRAADATPAGQLLSPASYAFLPQQTRNRSLRNPETLSVTLNVSAKTPNLKPLSQLANPLGALGAERRFEY